MSSARDHARSASSARSRIATSAGSVTRRGRGSGTSMTACTRAGRGLSTTIRSASTAASSTSCVTSSVVRGSRPSALAEPVAHLGARQRVERAERLVEAQQRLAAEQRAQERDALAHAAGELVRARVLEALEAERREQRLRALARLRPRPAPWMRSASAALSSASSHGSSRSRWGISTAGAAATLPALGARSPQTSSSSVVLPQPEGPTSATISCSATANVTSSTACSGCARRPRAGYSTADVPQLGAGGRSGPPALAFRAALRVASSSLPPRALPHRFDGSAPALSARSQPASASSPGGQSCTAS